MKTTQFICARQDRVNETLADYLGRYTSDQNTLLEALKYSVLNGGKRLRPLLVYATGEALGAIPEQLDSAACAVELIHAYSLVHDDLPAMDNDDMRRGLPSCHKAFGEAIAILAGDVLQTLAFEILSDDAQRLNEKQRLYMIATLAQASGIRGMAGGQALEFSSMQNPMTAQELEKIHRLKTGALIRASVKLGAIAANADQAQLAKLDDYASCLGLAYQIQDDVQDSVSVNDAQKKLSSYLSYVSIEVAQRRIEQLYLRALAAIDSFKNPGLLNELAAHLIRQSETSTLSS